MMSCLFGRLPFRFHLRSRAILRRTSRGLERGIDRPDRAVRASLFLGYLNGVRPD